MYRREAILRAVLDRLGTIQLLNGYATDIGNNVVYFQDYPVEYDGPPGCSLMDPEEDSEDVGGNQQEKKLHLRVDAIVYVRVDALSESINVLGDLIRAIGVDRRWGKLAIATYLGENTKAIETVGRDTIRVSQEFDVQYRVDAFKF